MEVWLGKNGAVFRTVGAEDWTSPIYPAWKVTAGDVDGDGYDELVLGIWSTTPRRGNDEPHKTIWVLRWNKRSFEAAWRGSAMARPLLDFELDETEDRADVVALERWRQKCSTARYHWTGFGFLVRDRESTPCP